MRGEQINRTLNDGPYAGKTVPEILYDYAVVRGDLTEQYARDALADIIATRIDAAVAEALDRVAAQIEKPLRCIGMSDGAAEGDPIAAGLIEGYRHAVHIVLEATP